MFAPLPPSAQHSSPPITSMVRELGMPKDESTRTILSDPSREADSILGRLLSQSDQNTRLSKQLYRAKCLKGSIVLRDETMRYPTNDSFITFNNGLGTPKTKSGEEAFREGVVWGDVLGGDFVLGGS